MQSSDGLIGKDSFSSSLTQCWQDLVPCRSLDGGLPIKHLTTWQLLYHSKWARAPKRVIAREGEGQQDAGHSFYNPITEVTVNYFGCIVFIRNKALDPAYTKERRSHRA